MPNPHVVALCLTADRAELTQKAVACFDAQTYANRSLIILDTSEALASRIDGEFVRVARPETPTSRFIEKPEGRSIGQLRNRAMELVKNPQSIIVHWDSDDWSHPQRIESQVAQLLESGKPVVGYNAVLFGRGGAAWRYHNVRPGYAICSSLMFRYSWWQQNPFADGPRARGATSECQHWTRPENLAAFNSMRAFQRLPEGGIGVAPYMVARIHEGNSSGYDLEDLIERGSLEWNRLPEWDEPVREMLS